MIIFIYACALNGAIGKDGDLPWRQSSDLQHFKRITLGGTIVMGRKTWESIPDKYKNCVDIETYPKIFDVNNGVKKSNVINIANENVYKALDQIIAEVAEVFYNSPFIHMGADEAKLDLYENVKEVKSFMNKNKLGNDIHELYRYFIVR